MNKQTEALKLALEALKKSRDRIVEQGGSGWKLHAQQCVNAITAIREALAEQPAQQQEPAQETAWQALPAGPIKVLHQCRAALIGPVADGLARRCAVAAIDAELARPAQQEPVGEITAEDMGRPFNAIRIGTHFYKEVPPVGTKLYTSSQPSKPWVGLTDKEIEQVCVPLGAAMLSFTEVARAIEAKLKEKNA